MASPGPDSPKIQTLKDLTERFHDDSLKTSGAKQPIQLPFTSHSTSEKPKNTNAPNSTLTPKTSDREPAPQDATTNFVSQVTCWYWSHSHCNFGDACSYAHDITGLVAGKPGTAEYVHIAGSNFKWRIQEGHELLAELREVLAEIGKKEAALIWKSLPANGVKHALQEKIDELETKLIDLRARDIDLSRRETEVRAREAKVREAEARLREAGDSRRSSVSVQSPAKVLKSGGDSRRESVFGSSPIRSPRPGALNLEASKHKQDNMKNNSWRDRQGGEEDPHSIGRLSDVEDVEDVER